MLGEPAELGVRKPAVFSRSGTWTTSGVRNRACQGGPRTLPGSTTAQASAPAESMCDGCQTQILILLSQVFMCASIVMATCFQSRRVGSLGDLQTRWCGVPERRQVA